MPRMRKGTIQIRFEILEFLYYALKPQLRTHIWRKATSLSYDDFLRHLSSLEELGLLENVGNGKYRLTRKGRKIYDDLSRSLPSIL